MNQYNTLPNRASSPPLLRSLAPGDERQHLLAHGGDRFPPADLEAVKPRTAGAGRKGGGIDPRIVCDATIGLADGLTVPFALTAGLSALGDTRIVIYGGFAELIAGALSMGLGGYLGAKSEIAAYLEIRSASESQIGSDPAAVRSSIHDVLAPYGLPDPALGTLVDHLSASPGLGDFLMKFHHCAVEPPSGRPLTSALTIATGYFLGGLVPLVPYFFVEHVLSGLYISVAVMALALFAFGYAKTGVVSGWGGRRRVLLAIYGGIQMVGVGGVAAGAAMGLIMVFSSLAEESPLVL